MSLDTFEDSEKSFEETDPLSEDDFHKLSQNTYRRRDRARWLIGGLALVILAQTIALVILARNSRVLDPSLSLWCESVVKQLVTIIVHSNFFFLQRPATKSSRTT